MAHLKEASVPLTDSYAAVCAVLWSEREVLETLACTIVLGHLLAYSGGSDPANRPLTHEQQDAIERLRMQEVLRAAVVETVGGSEPTLAELAALAPEPWATMLFEHLVALRTLAADLRTLRGFDQLSLTEFLR
jgi:hypothetical protein